jgi:hypothetical protein
LIEKLYEKVSIQTFLVSFFQGVIDKSCQLLSLSKQSVHQAGDIEVYLLFFKSASLKIREIMKNHSEQYSLQVPPDFYLTYNLIEMVQKLSINSQAIMSLFLDLEVDGSLYKKIYCLLKGFIQNSSNLKDKEVILNELSLNLFTEWFECTKESASKYHKEKQVCIQ